MLQQNKPAQSKSLCSCKSSCCSLATSGAQEIQPLPLLFLKAFIWLQVQCQQGFLGQNYFCCSYDNIRQLFLASREVRHFCNILYRSRARGKHPDLMLRAPTRLLLTPSPTCPSGHPSGC